MLPHPDHSIQEESDLGSIRSIVVLPYTDAAMFTVVNGLTRGVNLRRRLPTGTYALA